ncbi:MAG: hypothetical protein ACOYN3_05790 [Acidimicrobiia bacterium]
MADDTVQELKELFVYAPVGLAYFLRDTAPTFFQMFVARGRSIVTAREQAFDADLARAKGIGQLTVLFGKPEVEKRVRELRAMGESLLGEQLANWWPATANAHPYVAPTARPTVVPTESRTATLAIADYDSLAAAQIIEHLADLNAGDRDAIATYEAAHRNRRTILGRIDALRSA